VNSYRDPSGRMSFAELLVAVGQIAGIRRVRFNHLSPPRLHSGDCRSHRRDADPVRPRASAGAVGIDRGAAPDGARVHARVVPGANLVDQGGETRDQHDLDIIVGFPGETEQDLEDTVTLLEEVGYDAIFAFKYSPRPNTPATGRADSIPDEEKSRRLQVVLDRQREIQRKAYARHLGQVMEVMVEGTITRERR